MDHDSNQEVTTDELCWTLLMIAEGGEEEEECHEEHDGGDHYDEYEDESDYYEPSPEFIEYFTKLN